MVNLVEQKLVHGQKTGQPRPGRPDNGGQVNLAQVDLIMEVRSTCWRNIHEYNNTIFNLILLMPLSLASSLLVLFPGAPRGGRE
jgi:hypothetical protein